MSNNTLVEYIKREYNWFENFDWNFNFQNRFWYTALMFSCMMNDWKSKEIVWYEQDFNLEDEDWNTAFIHAILDNNVPLVLLLLEKGVDFTKKNKKKETPYVIAQKKSFETIVDILDRII